MLYSPNIPHLGNISPVRHLLAWAKLRKSLAISRVVFELMAKRHVHSDGPEAPARRVPHSSTSAYYAQGANGDYWAASPNSTNGSFMNLVSSQVCPANNQNRAHGFSVRCLKN